MGFRNKAGGLMAGLGVAFGLALTAVGAPAASAGPTPNMYECHPSTGWCYQTSPPYNPSFARSCRWNYTIPVFSGGMYYTGCTAGWWRPEVH